MTETSTTLPLRAVDVFEERLAELSDEFTAIARERSALDAREARLLAGSAALADAMADSLVSHDETPAQRKALVRRSARQAQGPGGRSLSLSKCRGACYLSCSASQAKDSATPPKISLL